MLDLNQFIQLIPRGTIWAQEQEQLILKNGAPLLPPQLEDAKIIPVKNPEKIRLLSVNQIPLPEDPELKVAVQTIQLITPHTVGLTLQYGIFIRNDHWNSRELIVHELVHTSQYERFGGIQQFLNRYLMECIQIGYPNAPLEQEAINKAKSICT
jgi:hypothetical protein